VRLDSVFLCLPAAGSARVAYFGNRFQKSLAAIFGARAGGGLKAKGPKGQRARRPEGQKARRPNGQTAKWPDGQMARRPNGQTARVPTGGGTLALQKVSRQCRPSLLARPSRPAQGVPPSRVTPPTESHTGQAFSNIGHPRA